MQSQLLTSREAPARSKKSAKRSSQEDVLREELERIMRHENAPQVGLLNGKKNSPNEKATGDWM